MVCKNSLKAIILILIGITLPSNHSVLGMSITHGFEGEERFSPKPDKPLPRSANLDDRFGLTATPDYIIECFEAIKMLDPEWLEALLKIHKDIDMQKIYFSNVYNNYQTNLLTAQQEALRQASDPKKQEIAELILSILLQYSEK